MKCIVLNNLPLTNTKKALVQTIFSEYLDVLNKTLALLKNAKSSLELHHLTYKPIKRNSFLPSDIIQEARKDVWGRRRTVKGGFRSCSIRMNRRWFRFRETEKKNPCFVLTYSPGKQFAIPVKMDGQFQRFQNFLEDDWEFSSISLMKDGRIGISFKKEYPTTDKRSKRVLGMDIGSSTLAAITIFDSGRSRVIKQIYVGRDIAIKQKKYQRRRAALQSFADRGSEKAKKALERLKHKQDNFINTRSGQIAKEVVNLAREYNADIAMERLRIGVKRGRFNKKTNRKINSIPYAKFRRFVLSNCNTSGVGFLEVDAYHTSKWCPHCGAVNAGHQSGNHAIYKCKNCGLIVNSDRKASLSIAIKSLLERNGTREQTGTVQISKRRVPVNGLLRPDETGESFAVQHILRPMESCLPQ